MASTAGARTAVFVRAHKVDLKVAHLLASLKGGRLYDLFVLADETNGPLNFPEYSKVSTTMSDFVQLGGYADFPQAPLFYSDLLFGVCARAAPGYDHYVLLEYDVHFLKSGAAWLERLAAALRASVPAVDVAGSHFHPANSGWMWFENCRKLYPNVYMVLFPLVVLSSRSIARNEAARRQEDANRTAASSPVFCEAFLPSTLLADESYKGADLNALVPGSYSGDTLNIVMPAQHLDDSFQSLSVEIVHPVKELWPTIRDPALRTRVRTAEANGPAKTRLEMRRTLTAGRALASRLAADQAFEDAMSA